MLKSPFVTKFAYIRHKLCFRLFNNININNNIIINTNININAIIIDITSKKPTNTNHKTTRNIIINITTTSTTWPIINNNNFINISNNNNSENKTSSTATTTTTITTTTVAKLSSYLEEASIEGGSASEGSARSALSLVLDAGHCALIDPAEWIRNWSFGLQEVDELLVSRVLAFQVLVELGESFMF
jgi:hypothetical protein